MRISCAILLFMWGCSVAFAQGDPRADYGPAKEAVATPPVDTRAAAPDAASDKTAEPKVKTEGTTRAARKKDATVKSHSDKADESPPKDKAHKAKSAARTPERTATSGSANDGAPAAKLSSIADLYAAMPPADRMALQNDLTWTGDYTGAIDGQSSDRLVEAVKSFQKRRKSAPSGVLGEEDRAALAAAVAPRQEAVGWHLTEDPVSGARLGVPAKFATKVRPGPSGTRWSSEQGQLQIETFRIDTGATLESVFDQQKKLPRRRIASSVLQADSFVITGMQGLKKMVVRAYARDGEVRGLTILYDQAMEGMLDPLVAPMSSAFVPFANFSAAGVPHAAQRKVEYGTGVIVSAAGHILTARALLDNCSVITIPGLGNAERIATDPNGDLALLRVYGARNLAPIALLGVSGGDGVTLVGIADPQTQGGGSAASSVPAQLGAGDAANARPLAAMPALGFSGAAALDAQGHVAGIVVMKAPAVAGPPAGAAPRAVLVSAERVRNFLEAHYVAPSSGRGGLEAAKASLVRVICVRK